MDDFELEIKQEFLSEASDLISEAEEVFLALENSTPSEEMLNQLFRVAHNLKGTSKAVGFDQISELTHHAENLILKIQKNEISLTSEVIDVLFAFKDKVEEMLDGFRSNLEAIFDISSVMHELELVLSGGTQETAVIDEEIPNEIQEDPMEASQLQQEEEGQLRFQDIEDVLAFQRQEQSKDDTQPKPKQESTSSKPIEDVDKDIRVKLSRIDKVNDYIGELVILPSNGT